MIRPGDEGGRPPQDAGEPRDSASLVVIGGSSGSVEPLGILLSQLTSTASFACVVAIHGPPDRDLSTVLQADAELDIREAVDGDLVTSGRVLILPGGRDGHIVDGCIRLTEAGHSHRPAPTIDALFESAAECFGCKCLGVILSGAGNDGTVGGRAIKAADGILVAQSPESARFDAMPVAAIATGLVDAILEPEQVGAELERLVANRAQFTLPEDSDAWLPQLISACLNHTGLDLGIYKTEMLRRRLQTRLAVVRAASLAEYVQFALNRPDELEAATRTVLISVTHFFRDRDAFKSLEHALHETFTHRAGPVPFRVWVPACATGEEVYSVAILIAECLRASPEQLPVIIYATDIDELALERARTGHFSSVSVRHIDPGHLARWFTPSGAGYKISKSLRQSVVFARHDLARDPPFPQLDLVVCRNLLIYLKPQVQTEILSTLHYSLRPNGMLFMGRSDSIGSLDRLFLSLNASHRLFRRKEGRTLASRRRTGVRTWEQRGTSRHPQVLSPGEVLSRTLAGFLGGAAVLVNASGQIEYGRGDVSAFFRLAEGEPGLSVADLAIDSLRPTLRSGLYRARHNETAVSKRGVRTTSPDGEPRLLDVDVLPVEDAHEQEPRFVVLIRPSDAGAPSPQVHHELGVALDGRIQELEAELVKTQESLQDAIEQLQTANEELHSLNQELMSTNEELQSANEELETSIEELQATNEEITTVNEELRAKTKALDHANTELERVFGTIPVPVIVLDDDLRVRRLSLAAVAELGLAQTTVGSRLRDVARHDSLRRSIPDIEQVQALNARSVCDYDAGGKSFRVLVEPLDDGEQQGVLVLVQDLTDARERERYFATLVENAPDVIARYDRHARHLYVNRALESFTERPREEWIGKTNRDLGFDESFWAPVDETVRRVFETSSPAYLAFDFEAPAGIKHFEARLVPEKNANGETVSVMAISRDTTDLHRATRALDNERTHSEVLLNSISDSFFSVDDDLIVTYFNEGSERMLHRSARTVVGRPLFQAFPEAQGSVFEKRYRDALARKQRDQFETYFEPHQEWYTVRVYPTPKGLGIFFEIITAQKNREAEVTRREKASQHAQKLQSLGTLAGGVAHEFNNVLMAIMGFSELLDNEPDLSPSSRSLVEEIMTAGRRGQSITRQILSFSRRTVSERGALSLNQVATSVARTFRKALPPGVHLELELAPELPVVMANTQQMEQVLFNLVANAKDAIETTGTITVKTSARTIGDADATNLHFDAGTPIVVVSVRDDGVGLSPESIDKIFDPFFTTKPAGKGTGLGLSIAYGIVRAFDGQITCTSIPGQGAQFDVFLPAAERGDEQAVSTMVSQPLVVGRGERILIVEDERSIREIYARFLEGAGFATVLAASGEEALVELEDSNGDFRAVLLDANMPGMGGLECLLRTRRLFSDLPVVVVTGYLEEENLKAMQDAGADRIVFKPVTGSELTNIVHQTVDRSS